MHFDDPRKPALLRPLREGVMQVGRHRLSLFRAVQDANDA
jgi:hypothetical protein